MYKNNIRNDDRRLALREPTRLEVYLQDEPRRLRGTAVDISRRGVFVETEWQSFSIGSLVDLVFVQREPEIISLLRYSAIVVRRYQGGVCLRFCNH